MPDKARETIEYYLKNVTDAAIGHFFLAFHYLTQGKPDLARKETEKAVILDPTYWPDYYAAGIVALLDGDFGQAEKEFSRLLAEKATLAISLGYDGLRDISLVEGKFSKFSRLYVPFIEQMREAGEKDNECYARCQLAYVYLKSGNPEKALDECRKAWAVAVGSDYLNYQRNILFLKGLTYLELKNIPEAEKAAEELKAVNARGMRKDVDIRIYDHLMGRIELEKKNYDGAIERLKKAVDSLPYGPLETDASYIDSLALAYFRAGELAKAQSEYERITALTTGRIDYDDIYAKSFYMLGQIFEQKGDKAQGPRELPEIPRPLEGCRPRPTRSRGREEAAGRAEGQLILSVVRKGRRRHFLKHENAYALRYWTLGRTISSHPLFISSQKAIYL